MFDKTLRVENDRFYFHFHRGKTKATWFEPSRELADVIFVYPNEISIGIMEGYTKAEYEADVDKMTRSYNFMNVISDFVPIKEMSDEDRAKLKSLYLQDQKAGKIRCSVYMGQTD